MNELNLAMATDLYELTMSQGYFNEKKTEEVAVFDAFFRKMPFDSGYAIMGGLDEIIRVIQNFRFTEKDIEYFRELHLFTEPFLEYLRNFRFHGSIYAILDGTVVFGGEPLVTVKAPLIEAQLVETVLLSYLNSHIAWKTDTKRISEASGGRAISEFGLRRSMSPIAGLYASKCSFIGGCKSTSNVLAGQVYGIPVSGTIAHSYITSFDSEYDAFLAYAKAYPHACTLLVDTYDVLTSGLPNAIRVAKEFLIPNGQKLQAIRIDSGDLAKLSKEARKMLDEAGLAETHICVSNGLDEKAIRSLLEQGAPIDFFGVGDNIVLPNYARVGVVYKNVALQKTKDEEFISKIKASNDEAKAITPGYKKVYRFYDNESNLALGDVLAFHNEEIPQNEFTLIDPVNNLNQTTIRNYRVRELQVPIFLDGKLVYKEPSIYAKQAYCDAEMLTIPEEVKRYEKPQKYFVDMTKDLIQKKRELLTLAKHQGMSLTRKVG